MFTISFDFNDHAESGPKQVSAALSHMYASSVSIRNIDGHITEARNSQHGKSSSIEYAYELNCVELVIEQDASKGLYRWQLEAEAFPKQEAPNSNDYHNRWCAEHPDCVIHIFHQLSFSEAEAFTILYHTQDVVLRTLPPFYGSSCGVPVRERLAEYTWDELKSLSQIISAMGSDKEGLAIAKGYGLADISGRLRGDTKPVTLADGTKASVRVAGFRHDTLVSGGVAGITFEFADVPAEHSMNEKHKNAYGWKWSAMREWLNADFLALLPSGLRELVEPARKRTNNRGKVEEGDKSCVTETEDSLWLLSVSEVYGSLWLETSWASTYHAEGTQYQLYADKGVMTSDHGFCMKGGAGSWWLRSPNANYSGSFLFVNDDGDWVPYKSAGDAGGVSPGFCL